MMRSTSDGRLLMQLHLNPTLEDYRVAKLAALAIGIHVIESALPSPIPGVKLGLANIITLIAFLLYGVNSAAWVSLLRVVVGSLIIGTFLSPTFVLSLSGALASISVLYLFSVLTRLDVSAIGIGIVMALAHVISQFIVVYAFFIPHNAVFNLLPIMMTAALIFGLLNGILAQKIYDRIKLN